MTTTLAVLLKDSGYKLTRMVNDAFESQELARKHQTDAEEILLRALNLKGWQAPDPLSYVRQSSEAFAAGRLGGSQLLEAAKRAIEIAIEDSEAAALAYLSQVAPPELAPIDY